MAVVSAKLLKNIEESALKNVFVEISNKLSEKTVGLEIAKNKFLQQTRIVR